MKYLVDSDWLIDAAAGRPTAAIPLTRLSADGLAVSIIAVAEVYEGAFGTADPAAALRGLREFLSDFAVLPLTDAIAARFGLLRATLRRQSQLIPEHGYPHRSNSAGRGSDARDPQLSPL